jgi:hypothetical protein
LRIFVPFFLGNKKLSQANSAPATGELEDIVWNTAPTAGGALLWVCVFHVASHL